MGIGFSTTNQGQPKSMAQILQGTLVDLCNGNATAGCDIFGGHTLSALRYNVVLLYLAVIEDNGQRQGTTNYIAWNAAEC